MKIELSTICRQFNLTAPDGKKRETDCANTENIFRIIQSIPSPKAEPFKQWLAKLGKERIDEIENPELGKVNISYNKNAQDTVKVSVESRDLWDADVTLALFGHD